MGKARKKKKYELRGGLRVNLAHALRRLVACPIHKRKPTRMTREGFIRTCLAIQQGRRAVFSYKADIIVEEPENPSCKHCLIGEMVREESLASEPPFIKWIPVEEEFEIKKNFDMSKTYKSHGYKEAADYTTIYMYARN